VDILKIVVLAVTAAALTLLVRQYRPEIAMQLGIAAGVLILLLAIDPLISVFSALTDIARKYDIDTTYIGVVIKIIGITYIVQFAVNICKDAGENAIAGKMELAGKITILLLALPAVFALIELVLGLMPYGTQ
jgi:stage III sporulation protein AD